MTEKNVSLIKIEKIILNLNLKYFEFRKLQLIKIKLQMKKSLYTLFVLTLLITSCSKYSEGPSFSLFTKKDRLCNDWVLLTQLKNDEDVTDDKVTNKLTIEKDGTYSTSATYDALGQLKGDYTYGKWSFGDSKDVLNFFEITNNEVPLKPNRTFKIKELRRNQIKLVEEFPSVELNVTYIYVTQ